MRNKKQRDRGFWLFIVVMFCLAFLAGEIKAAEYIPQQANHYKRDLVRASQTHWGLNGPVARFAAQVHQESSWKSDAQSIYAKGLAQFTPDTAQWINGEYTIQGTPFSPRWSLNALARYDRHIYDSITKAASDCDRWAFTLSGYNGGPGWIKRDRRLALQSGADANRWFGAVEHHTKRRAQAKDENRDYVRRILLKIEPRYIAHGWAGSRVCGEA